MRRYKKEAMVNGGGREYSLGTMSPSKNYNGYHNQSLQSYSYRTKTPPPRNSSPIINYPATYPQLQTKDIVCGFCKHRFYIGKDLKATYSPLLLPCGHATCSTCESLKPGRPCLFCPDFPVDIESRKRLPYNLYVIGLVHTIVSTPLHIEDADIQFHVPLNAIARQHFEQGSCSECGMVAYYDCKQCAVQYCKFCFKKMHRKALQSHKAIPLNKNAFDFTINTFCPNHETEATEYYCDDCDFEGCSHCIIKLHAGHSTKLHIERNKDWILEFRAAFAKLQDTRLRVHQTQQSLTSKMVCPEAMKQAQAVENQITRHFVHLHGVLQNLEQELRNKLRKQRSNLQRDVEEFRKKLAGQEEKLTSACALAARAESNCGRVNLQKLTTRLLELADTPCHVVQMDDYKEEIKMETDSSIYDTIKQHVELYVPDVPRFHLVKTDDLPEDYELEPLPLANETMITESSFRFSSQRDVSSPALSTHSNSSSPSLNDSIMPEPSSLEKGSKEIVHLSHFVDPTEFYVQRLSTKCILQELEEDIAKYIESDPPKPEEIILNVLYVAQNLSEMKWCRGRVISVMDSLPVTYKILFIDYGYVESNLTLDAIRCAKPQFNIQPALAVQCSLAEIAPVEGNQWEQEVLDRFLDIACNSYKLTIHVLHVNEPVRIVELISFGNNNMATVSFREWLIDVKLAKPTTYYKLKRMNPLSVHHFFLEDLPIHKYTNVQITYIESPNSIYVKKVHQEKDYQAKMQQFYYEYNQLERHEDLSIKLPEYGNTVALRDKNIWHRGIITGIHHEESTVDVFLVDIGSSQRVPYSHLRRLSNRFCTWNAQVIRVSLVDIKPIDSVQWPVEVINFLKHNLEGHQVSIIPFSKTEETFDVCMYFSDHKTNINALLVSQSYAESTGHRSKHAVLNKDLSVSKKNRKKATKNVKAIKEIAAASSPTPKLEKSRPVEENDPYKVRIDIKKTISPDIIYVSVRSNRESYQTMMAEMQKFYKSKKGRVQGPLDPKWIYCVYSRKDKQFCRAQLLDIPDSNPSIVKMTLVDLGEVEEISLDEIQPLEPRFVDIPKYQFKVRLAGIEPCGGSKAWQSSSCQKLKDIINDTGDFKYYITLIEDSGPKDPMPVELFIKRNIVAGPTEPNRKEILSVARCLIEHGLALPIRGFNIKNEELKELAVELKKKLQFDSSHYDSTKQISEISKTIIEEESFHDNSDSDANSDVQKVNSMEKELQNISSDSTPLPPKVIDWIEPAHIQETNFNANVTFVDYEGNVNFHPDTKEYQDTLKYISDTLFKHYDKRSIKSYDYKWEVGDLCIASFHVDKKWYRGKIMEVISHQTVLVLFVDYGNIEECSVGSLKKRIILEHIPIQCTKARIAGIKPVDRTWKVSDLDIIHACVVSQPCKMKIVSRPPNPWEVAVWIKPSGNTPFYPLPWYLKNKTTTSHIEIDNNTLYCQNDENFQENFKSVQLMKKVIKNKQINNSVSTASSSNEEELHFAASHSSSSVESVVVFDEVHDNFSLTLRNNSDMASEITVQMNHCNLSTAVNNALSKKNLRNTSDVNLENASFNEEIHEKVLSGNSIYLNMNGDNDFETESVKSEVLLRDANRRNLVASTPLNTTYQDIDPEVVFGPIDFLKYEISVMEISISSMQPDRSFSGYIFHTPNEELNQWIERCIYLQEEIFDLAEKQPIHDIKLGKNCIAKYSDGKWYRARIIRKVTNEFGDGVQVEFVDFGNRMCIYDSVSLRTIKDEWLQIPMIGIHFKLSNVQFDKSKNLKDLHSAVMNILSLRNKFTAIIKKYEPILELELYWDNDCKKSVFTEMYETGVLEILNSSVD